jgi:hypothetical protein
MKDLNKKVIVILKYIIIIAIATQHNINLGPTQWRMKEVATVG